MISVASIIGTQLTDKGKERNESAKNGLQRMEKELNQEFLQDFFCQNNLLAEDIKDVSINFFCANLENRNTSFLDFFDIVSEYSDLEELSSDYPEQRGQVQQEFSEELIGELENERIKKKKFLNLLRAHWTDDLNKTVNNLWAELKEYSEKLLEINSISSYSSARERSNSDVSMEIFNAY